MQFIARLAIFLTFFLTFGAVGILLDIFTGGKYNIRVRMYDAKDVAASRVKRFVSFVKGGWLWSPLFFVAFVLSVPLFVFFFIVYLIDAYRTNYVWYTENGQRIAFQTSEITEEDIAKAGKVKPTVTGWLLDIFSRKEDAILVGGHPIPAGWIACMSADEAQVKKAKHHKFRKYGIAGNYWYAPPASANQEQGLSDYSDLEEE